MKHYLFDFDGTLVDSMPTFVSAVLSILDDNQIPYGEDIIKIITPLGFLGTAKYFVELGLEGDPEEIVEEMKLRMQDAYFHTIPAKRNVIETLREMKAQGADLNVLTASPHLTLDACLKRLGIYDLFTNVWSCDDFNTSKADPDIYRRAAEKIGCKVEEVLFLDDNLGADTTAKTAGATVCGVYDDSSADYVEQIKAVADFYIYDFAELPGLGKSHG